MKIEFSRKFRSQLLQVQNYYLEIGSTRSANRIINGILAIIRSLQSNPYLAPRLFDENYQATKFRCLKYKKDYKVVYTVENDKILVVLLLHSSQDIERLLDNL